LPWPLRYWRRVERERRQRWPLAGIRERRQRRPLAGILERKQRRPLAGVRERRQGRPLAGVGERRQWRPLAGIRLRPRRERGQRWPPVTRTRPCRERERERERERRKRRSLVVRARPRRALAAGTLGLRRNRRPVIVLLRRRCGRRIVRLQGRVVPVAVVLGLGRGLRMVLGWRLFVVVVLALHVLAAGFLQRRWRRGSNSAWLRRGCICSWRLEHRWRRQGSRRATFFRRTGKGRREQQ
jgi:hypothetical protein